MRQFFLISTLFSFLCVSHTTNAEEPNISAYFFNDSVNGFQLSDAYETHNMGLKLEFKNEFYQLDLGIVTPDMFEFDNQYRQANRSFGELISFTYGREAYNDDYFDLSVFSKLTSQGEFGISGFQSIIHQFANFQDDIDLLETVRMPSQTWFGLGGTFKFRPNLESFYSVGLQSYIGTDRVSANPYVEIRKDINKWSQFGRLGAEYVLYDNIISAPPVNAEIRRMRPKVSFGVSRQFGPVSITISENLSSPTILDDDRIYARLYMSATVSLNSLQALFDNMD